MIENDKDVDFFCVFPNKFLSKTTKRVNEIHKNIIDNDINEPIPEHDTTIEHEESNKEDVTEVQLKEDIIENKYNDEVELITFSEKARDVGGLVEEQEDNLDLNETDKDTHKFGEKVQPEEGRLRPHNRVFFGSKGFRR